MKDPKIMKSLKLILTACLALAVSVASAQTMRVSTGSAAGTYSKMFKELSAQCVNQVPMVEIASTGSMENLTRLIGNEVNAAFTQTDVLVFRAKTEELGNVKTLLAFHPEEVHIVARAQSGVSQGGVGAFGVKVGDKPVVFNTLADLNGYAVAASGGSYITAQVIRLQSEIGFTVQSYETNELALAALAAGTVQAVVMVGGEPLEAVSKLSRAYKLLSVPEASAAKMKGVYRSARLTYPNLGAAGVPTVATDALFVTREYKTPKMQAALANFRACAVAAIDELKETTGTHKKWQVVDTENHGKWAYYELPKATAPVAAPVAVPARKK